MAVRKAPGRWHHGDLREVLVQLAADTAAREGVEAVRIADLARAAGVSAAAPFKHFPTRLALLVAAAEEAGRRLLAHTSAATAGLADPAEAQRAAGVAYVRFAVEEPGWFRILNQPEVLRESAYLRGAQEQSQMAMEGALGTTAGEAAPALLDRSASVLAAQATAYGLARMFVDGLCGPVGPDEAERLAGEVLDVLGRGLAAD